MATSVCKEMGVVLHPHLTAIPLGIFTEKHMDYLQPVANLTSTWALFQHNP